MICACSLGNHRAAYFNSSPTNNNKQLQTRIDNSKTFVLQLLDVLLLHIKIWNHFHNHWRLLGKNTTIIPPPPSSAPIMNSIQEEENTIEPSAFPQPPGFHTPLPKSKAVFNSPVDSTPKPALQSPSLPRPPHAFYASYEGNNSSSSLIYNPSFTFGDTNTSSPTAAQAPQTPQQQQLRPPTSAGSQSSATKQSNRQSRYIPGPKLAPPTTRTRSPTRSSSPDTRVKRNSRPSSALFEAPFNLAPPPPSMQTPPPSSASSNTRAMFRKGHRYKHSSVSMNFFQEPEVKVPLNIAKSLPIPNFNDLTKNLSWPRAHFQLLLTFIQLCMCLLIFQLGHHNSWSNFGTLSHFIAYDVIGSIAIIFVENLSQFEVWSTGTITYPFGLNRIEVLISFSLAVSLCFVGLDLLFHMAEEFIVLFVELNHDNHEDIAPQIPHSHHGAGNLFSKDSNFALWYPVLVFNLLISVVSLYKIFYANKYSKLKTKNPIITITYTLYLLLYPSIVGYLSAISDYLAAIFIATIILFHGVTIAEWTSTILLLGFSTTTLPRNHFLGDALAESSQQGQLGTMIKKRSVSGPVLTEENTVPPKRSSSWFPWTRSSKAGHSNDTTVLKSIMKEEIEKLPEFLTKCTMHYDNFFVAKVSFNLYVVLVNVTLRGGSDADELNLRLAVDKCIRRILPNAETTVEIDRI